MNPNALLTFDSTCSRVIAESGDPNLFEDVTLESSSSQSQFCDMTLESSACSNGDDFRIGATTEAEPLSVTTSTPVKRSPQGVWGAVCVKSVLVFIFINVTLHL